MATLSTGLIVTPNLTQRNVSIDMHFEPSVGILARKVDKLGLDIRSFNVPLRRAIKQVVAPSIRHNFDSGGRPPWEPLSEQTVLRKSQLGYGPEPLIRTGALRRVASQLNIWTIDREKAMVTDLPESVWYGKVHQAGASFGIRGGGFAQVSVSYLGRTLGQAGADTGDRGEIPQRRFIMVQESDLPQIDHVFEEWLAERVAAAGLS